MSNTRKKLTTAEEQARIDEAVANVRRRTRPVREIEDDQQGVRAETGKARAMPAESAQGNAKKQKQKHKRDRSRSADYEVGYGKPPVHTRFQPGQSGNAPGRPKASRNTTTIIREELFKTREVTIDGKKQRMPQFKIGMQQLMVKFMTGDARAAAQVINLLSKLQELGADRDEAPRQHSAAALEITESEMQMLARYQADLFREAGMPDDQIGQILTGLGLPALDHDMDLVEQSDGLSDEDDGDEAISEEGYDHDDIV